MNGNRPCSLLVGLTALAVGAGCKGLPSWLSPAPGVAPQASQRGALHAGNVGTLTTHFVDDSRTRHQSTVNQVPPIVVIAASSILAMLILMLYFGRPPLAGWLHR